MEQSGYEIHTVFTRVIEVTRQLEFALSGVSMASGLESLPRVNQVSCAKLSRYIYNWIYENRVSILHQITHTHLNFTTSEGLKITPSDEK